jgi:hypothetical protein
MKKSRLLEIIREEISSVLSEAATTYAGKSSIDDLKKDKAFGSLSGDAKTDTIEKLNSGGTVTIGEEKAKKLAEKYQLDEETINEMASVVQTKKALQKLGDEAKLKIVQDVEKETLAQFRKNPIVSSDGRLARKLEPEEVTGKRDTRGYGADFERNFKKKAGMDFLDFTTSIDIELKKKFPEEKFTPGLATNTTEKDAANQITGKEPGQRGRKADPNKPEKPASTGKKGRPAGAPKAKVATRTPGDDGFDKVEYSDSEDIETTQAPAGDTEMEKAARGRDELTKQYRGVMDTYKKMKAEEGDQAALEYLKTKQNIVKAYKKAQTVNV